MKIYTSEVEMLRAECKEWEKVCDQHLRYINKLKKKIAKQEQSKPVAWVNLDDLYDLEAGEDGDVPYVVRGNEQPKNMPKSIPLYTAPQPAQKPLTDEEIGAILEGVNAYGTRLYTFARAIEAAHGIKENT